jgi:tetratricopeptide (TPR) repeat protein
MANQPVYVENELFLGRLDEQDRFREVLRTVLAPQDDDAPSYIFLIHGVGGMGKSQLTRRLRDIVLCEPPFEGSFHVLLADWEEIRFHTPALRVARDQIQPEDVLAALHRAALDAGWGRHFGTYQKTLEQRKQAEQEVARALDREASESRHAALRDLGAAALAKLVRTALPVVGQTGENLTQALLAEGIQLGAEGAARLRSQAEEFLRARLKPELYEIYRQPHERLARALGDGLRRVSHERPLLLFMDTYEIVALAADTWLRQVVKSAGLGVVWVISGRDNLAPSRAGDRYVGYSAEFPRRLTVWDMQELAIEYVGDYLRDRAPRRHATREEAAAIHRATLGVPLALRQAADLWAQGVPLTAITEGIPDYAPRGTIVRLMCERVLMHVEQGAAGEADRRALYALAMQPRPDPGVQAILLRPVDGPFDLSAHLADMARRYSVVQIEGGARLHDAMGAFVREYLTATEARAGDLVRQIAERAVATLRARRATLEADLPTLAERSASADWRQATLDLIVWLFWEDERAAWHELVPRLVEGMGYELDLAHGLLRAAGFFERAMSQDGRQRLRRLALNAENRPTLSDELEKLAGRGWLDEGGAESAAERRTILGLWRGRWLAGAKRYEAALQAYLEAERRLPSGAADLGRQLGRAFYELGGEFLWPEGALDAIPSEPGLQAAERATELDVENGDSWYRLGVAWAKKGAYQEAIAAYQKAIELDPKYAYPWNGLGNVYRAQGRHEEAIAAYQKAIELDPKYAYPWNGLGNVYHALGRHKEAIATYQHASQLDPKLAHPWYGLGNVYRDLGRHEEAIAAYQQASRLDPKLAHPWYGLGHVHRGLGRHEAAISAFQHAIELDPKDAYPWCGLGFAFNDLSRHEEAISAFQHAIELDPKDADPWHGLGNVYRDLDRHEEAIAAYQQAIELDPKDASPWNGLGVLYELAGKLEDALRAHQRATELQPDEGICHSSLASVLGKLGLRAEAAEHLARARELISPNDHYSRACLEAIAGNDDAALEQLAKALVQAPGGRVWARHDPDLATLHGDPRFEALVGNDAAH